MTKMKNSKRSAIAYKIRTCYNEIIVRKGHYDRVEGFHETKEEQKLGRKDL